MQSNGQLKLAFFVIVSENKIQPPVAPPGCGIFLCEICYINPMKISEELAWRGFIQQTTLKDLTFLDDKKITFYHGFDASAPSQTVGNLAAMMMDLVFIRHGHKAIILAGGATSLIGDPGGRDIERPMQSVKDIDVNVKNAKTDR